MSTKQQPDFAELNALAIEACDMWQEHLSALASDPKARAELTRFLEPQRRLFADWASMMQKGAPTHCQQGEGSHDGNGQPGHESDGSKPAAGSAPTAPSRGAEHGDDALRVAQLALRVAELERRLAQLESRSPGAPRAAQRATS